MFDRAKNATDAASDPAVFKAQMDAFLYTCVILLFFAVIIVYFMLRQICRQDREYHQQWHGQLPHSDSFKQRQLRDREIRSNIKKQLCVHLIKMGQLAGSIVDSNNQAPLPHTSDRHQTTDTDDLSSVTARRLDDNIIRRHSTIIDNGNGVKVVTAVLSTGWTPPLGVGTQTSESLACVAECPTALDENRTLPYFFLDELQGSVIL